MSCQPPGITVERDALVCWLGHLLMSRSTTTTTTTTEGKDTPTPKGERDLQIPISHLGVALLMVMPRTMPCSLLLLYPIRVSNQAHGMCPVASP